MSIRTLTAAAQRFTRAITKKQTKTGGNNGWQQTAWDLYEAVPETRFVANWIGDAAGGARIYAARRAEDGSIEPLDNTHPAAEIVSQIAGGPDGQAQLLNEASVHLSVAGEFWLAIAPTDDSTIWHVLSVSEVTQARNGLTVEIAGEKIEIPAADDDTPPAPDAPVAFRVWQPHPRRRVEADSLVRSSLVVLEELRLLNAAVAAVARSRITGRGVLIVPKGARFPTAPGQGEAEDDLLEVFMEVAATAIREPESAAATVPIILEIPADLVGKVEWLTFESGFDELAMKLRDEAIRRFAAGAEIPAEILLGLGDSNHWSAWLVSAEGIRLGVEPKLRLICEALTTQWLRPLLEVDDVPDAGECLVWFDTSQMRVQANRAQTALEAFQLGLISAQAARREVGFDEADAPTEGDTPPPANEPGSSPPELPADDTASPPDTAPEGTENEEAAA